MVSAPPPNKLALEFTISGKPTDTAVWPRQSRHALCRHHDSPPLAPYSLGPRHALTGPEYVLVPERPPGNYLLDSCLIGQILAVAATTFF